MTEKQGNVLSLIIWIFAVIVMIAGLVFMICYTEKRDKAFNASHHQEEICGEVGENLVAGGWRKADIVYYDVTWDDGTKTRESAYPAFAPLKGDKTCKIIWVAN